MGKLKKSSSRFSSPKPVAASQQQVTRSSATQVAKEQQAVALINQGNLQEAEAIYRELAATGSKNHIVYCNLGVLLKKKGDLQGAIASYNTALQLKPNYPEAHYNLGIALKEQGNLDAAIASYNRALQLKPNDPEVHNNLGNALKDQGDLVAAIASYNTALRLEPSHRNARWNSSLAMLLDGNYKHGWKRFDARFAVGIRLDAYPSCPPWKGEVTTKEAPLLLISEQGFGDTLQFMRYLLALRERGVEVSLCIPEKLHGIARSSGLAQSPMSPKEAESVARGFHVPLMTLAGMLGVTPQNPVVNHPYITADSEQAATWNHLLAGEGSLVIGIHWQGNPDHEIRNLAGRSLPLERFAPAASAIDCKLLSLQKGFGSEQLDTCSFRQRFVSCQDQVNETWDFLETAAIIANCDLVITSDSAVAHLAGGMGKNTWLLLKKIPDWRWGVKGDTTFWYPSMRLFRQKEYGNWDEVMERVAEALQEHFGSHSMPDKGAMAPRTEIMT